MIVREGAESDIPEMVSLGEKFWHLTHYYHGGEDYNKERCAEIARLCMDSGVVFVADSSGIKGFIMMFVAPSMFSTRKMACEVVFFVHPDHRGCGAKLMLRAEKKAKELGCSMISMISIDSVNPETPEALYIRLGYRKAETTFSKFI
jgi:GNAT superfamily N-acetyltransferase